MNFSETALPGVRLIRLEPHHDERGLFQRLWCRREFEAEGLPGELVQISLSVTNRKGTLRGMHYQGPPFREDKVVFCLAGRIHDVAVDLRPQSPTFLRHDGVELSPGGPQALFIPAGCAHGFLTLEDNCTVGYMMTDFYDPDASNGLRWNDPRIGIRWPAEPLDMLPRDAGYPDLDVDRLGFADAN